LKNLNSPHPESLKGIMYAFPTRMTGPWFSAPDTDCGGANKATCRREHNVTSTFFPGHGAGNRPCPFRTYSIRSQKHCTLAGRALHAFAIAFRKLPRPRGRRAAEGNAVGHCDLTDEAGTTGLRAIGGLSTHCFKPVAAGRWNGLYLLRVASCHQCSARVRS
jgi:hypothetical protein